ncbi:phospholipase D-like domain-containing protein [Maribacter arcticus]|uniref:phospholipase D-like domain-containing protein n=1 Tax=Maribacter arcticus TaxID=561365 RepID=UPI0030030870
MSYKVFFDGPNSYNGKYNFFRLGGSPRLVKEFVNSIENEKSNIEEITIVWYLFNNHFLHNYLKNLSKSGVKINVITIPLEGYDSANPKHLINLENNEKSNKAYTKYDIARMIFKEMYYDTEYPNYKLHFFSHLYVRSPRVKKFSRGQFPYSLHIKSAYIKKKNGFLLILSSSNLAVRDLVKHESMLLIQDEPNFDSSRMFFEHILKNSIPIKNYSSKNNRSKNSFQYINSTNTINHYFTAPFYFDSSNILELEIIKIISKAKNRVIVSGQHLSSYNYNYDGTYHSKKGSMETREGIFSEIIKLGLNNIKITCLSQTYVDFENNHNFRRPANIRNFTALVEALNQLPNIDYYVNSSIHSKFIIVDNILIFCTYNFTPTQFTFLDNVNINSFSEMPGLSYQGIHCEVAGHVVIDNRKILESFLKNVELIINDSETKKVM